MGEQREEGDGEKRCDDCVGPSALHFGRREKEASTGDDGQLLAQLSTRIRRQKGGDNGSGEEIEEAKCCATVPSLSCTSHVVWPLVGVKFWTKRAKTETILNLNCQNDFHTDTHNCCMTVL